jgi:hypothetical protein
MIASRKTQALVKSLLTEHPSLRESDERLIANIWYKEVKQITQKENATALELLKLLSEKKLTNSESIRRSRQKTQELYPELRGKNYKKRKEETAVVKENLGYKTN